MSAIPEATSTPKGNTPTVETPAHSENRSSAPGASSWLDKERLLATVKSVKFVWFLGHLTTLVSVIFFSLTYVRVGARFFKFWHFFAWFGVIQTFGVFVLKDPSNIRGLIRDDNTQYFLLSVLLLILRPYVWITLVPFALFSFFHVLVYLNTYLVPVVGLGKSSVSAKVSNFITNNQAKSIQLASVVEIYAYGWLFLRLITIRKRSLVPFVVYSIFLKARYESSEYTRNYIKTIEISVESLINKHAANVPAVKQGWITFKSVIRKIGSFHIVNNYSKEKLT